MADLAFSLELSDDHREMQKWLHEFAAEVIRPAAHEWDEREETPWPVIQEAAKVGVYSLDFMAQQWFDESGLGMVLAQEELFWGDAGIGLAIMGTGLAAAAVSANGTNEQIGEFVPAMYGTPDDIKLGAFCSSEPDAGSDVGAMKTRAIYDEAKDEWVLNGTKTWATNGGIADWHVIVASVDPQLATRGQASFVVPPGTKGLSQGQKFKKHGIRASHTAEVVLDDVRLPSKYPARRQGQARRPAQPRARRAAHRTVAAVDGDLRAHPADGRRAGGRDRASGLRGGARLREAAGAVRPTDHREPGHRVQDRRHEDAHRRVAAARVARGVDGEAGQGLLRGRGLAVQAVRRRNRRVGDRAGHPDPRRQRLHPRVPGRADAPGREDLHHLRRYVGDPAPRHRTRGERHLYPLR